MAASLRTTRQEAADRGLLPPTQSWDIVVMVQDRVAGIIELKSMAGPSGGKNFSNRTDEALGQAMDVWTAVERGLIDTPLRPWLGYFMLLEDITSFNEPVKARKPVWQPDPAFDGSSYADRHAIFFDRMVRERLLDAACVVLADKSTGRLGSRPARCRSRRSTSTGEPETG